jgi:hypothetical protein
VSPRRSSILNSLNVGKYLLNIEPPLVADKWIVSVPANSDYKLLFKLVLKYSALFYSSIVKSWFSDAKSLISLNF